MITDSQTYSLDNKTPTIVTRQKPESPAKGTVPITATAQPAPMAGAGFYDDSFDRVEYKAGTFTLDLTHSDGYYDEQWQWIPTPYGYTGSWNTADQFTPENAPDQTAAWGDPKYPDGDYTQEVKAYFGPNTKSCDPTTIHLQNKGKISGIVKDLDTGLPVAGAEVKAVRSWSNPAYDWNNPDPNVPMYIEKVFGSATTDTAGAWEIALYPGSYSLKIRHTDYVQGASGADLGPGEEKSGIEIQLERRIKVTVTGGPGSLLADGSSQATLQATAKTQEGAWVPDGTVVTFNSDYGVFPNGSTAETVDGIASVNLKSGELSKEDHVATITASADGSTSNPLKITFEGVIADLDTDKIDGGAPGVGGTWRHLSH